MTTGGLPYNTLEAFGDTMQSRSNAGSDDENPMTVFSDQGKLKEKQKKEEELRQLEDRIQQAIWAPSTWLHSK